MKKTCVVCAISFYTRFDRIVLQDVGGGPQTRTISAAPHTKGMKKYTRIFWKGEKRMNGHKNSVPFHKPPPST